MSGALDGIRVVDMSTVVMGPWATQMLGDMGADVIKIETPGGDISRGMGPNRNPGMSAVYLSINRNKRSVALDLTQAAGREALFRIVGTADVFLHNMRPRIAEKFGVGYDKFAARQPDLIYCAAYGFRSDGPFADKPAYDDIIQAASGIADLQSVINGEPRFVPTIMADKTTAYNVAVAILAALVKRGRSGGGQAIEVPMFETLVDFVMVEHLYGACFDPPIGGMGYSRILNAERKPYATLDGHLAVLPYTDENWSAFFRIAGREDLAAHPSFASFETRVRDAQTVYGILAEVIATRTTAEWQRDLDAAQIPVMAVNSKEALLNNEQLDASGFWHMVEHPTEGRLRMTDPPVRFSASPSSLRLPAPRLGEHSREILAEAGYGAAEIDAMIAAAAIRQAP